MSSPLSAFDARAHRGAIGLFLLERAALAFGVGARRFVGGEAIAHHGRRALEVGLDVGLDVGVGEQLDPRDAGRRVGLAQLARSRVDRRQAAHLRDEIARLLLIRVLVGRDRSRPAPAAGCARLQQRARLLLRRLGARLLGDRGQRVVRRIAQPVDRRHRGVGVLAAQRHAFDFGGDRSAARARRSRAPASAACRAMLPSAFSSRTAGNRGAADLVGTRGLARPCASSRSRPSDGQRGHRGHARRRRRASTPARPAGRARDRARCLRTRCARCRRAPTASPMRATATRRTRASVSSLANAFSDSSRRIELVDRFDADVGIGVRGLGLRAELVENSHGSFRPRRPVGPAGAFLVVQCQSVRCVLRTQRRLCLA